MNRLSHEFDFCVIGGGIADCVRPRRPLACGGAKDMCKSLLAILCIAVFLATSVGVVAATREVQIQLTYPSGQSPKVFTTGWLFGAKATADGKDITGEVQWSGTGTFAPAKGNLSRPSFAKPGTNTITLSVEHNGRRSSRSFVLTAVSPDGYAAVGDFVRCDADAHGCPACPHPVRGVISRASPNVLVNGKPAARKGDGGGHAACCGPNIFEIVEGDAAVLIDGKPAARKGDKTKHCGGAGVIEGSGPTQGGTRVLPGPAGSSRLHGN